MKNLLSSLFANLPKDHFKLPMKDFKATGSYIADDESYEIFQHKELRMQLVVHLDSLKVVGIKIGRFQA